MCEREQLPCGACPAQAAHVFACVCVLCVSVCASVCMQILSDFLTFSWLIEKEMFHNVKFQVSASISIVIDSGTTESLVCFGFRRGYIIVNTHLITLTKIMFLSFNPKQDVRRWYAGGTQVAFFLWCQTTFSEALPFRARRHQKAGVRGSCNGGARGGTKVVLWLTLCKWACLAACSAMQLENWHSVSSSGVYGLVALFFLSGTHTFQAQVYH